MKDKTTALKFVTEEGLKQETKSDLETLYFSNDTFASLKTVNLQSTFSLMETFGTGRDCPS